MIPEIDIWRSATELIKRHGDEAPVQAAMRADDLLSKGDLDGRAVWMQIVKAIEVLLAAGPRPGDTAH